jgi:hypothetical protein
MARRRAEGSLQPPLPPPRGAGWARPKCLFDVMVGAVVGHFNLPFGDLTTGAVVKGTTLYLSQQQGGLLALNTVTGHIRQVVAEPNSNTGFFDLLGLPQSMVFYGNDLFYLVVSQRGKAFVKEVNTATGKAVRVIIGPWLPPGGVLANGRVGQVPLCA